MTYGYHDREALPPPTRFERAAPWVVSVVLTVVGGASLFHLVGQYHQATPWREAQEVRRQAERAAADARRELERQPPVPTDPYDLTAPGEDVVVTAPRARTAEERRIIEEFERRERKADRSAVTRPVSWAVRPSWPRVPDSAFPPGVSRIEVQFRCQVNRQGVLSRCTSTETPSGSGLAARMRPAIDEARLNPMIVDGRPVDSEVTFGVSFSARLAAPPPPTPVTQPNYMPPSTLPSADRLDRPSTPAPPPAEPAQPKPAPEG